MGQAHDDKGRRRAGLVTHAPMQFVLEKFGIMGLTRRREADPSKRMKTMPIQRRLIFLQGVKVPVMSVYKFLGVMLDQEL